jgi:hypothetical protein
MQHCNEITQGTAFPAVRALDRASQEADTVRQLAQQKSSVCRDVNQNRWLQVHRSGREIDLLARTRE